MVQRKKCYRTGIVFFALLLLAVTSGCQTISDQAATPIPTATPRPVPTPTPTLLPPIDFATIAQLQNECDTIRAQHQRVVLSGRLELPYRSTSFAGWISIGLVQGEEDDSESIQIWIRVGDGNNQMESLPKRYEQADLKVRTESGEVRGAGDFVTIVGSIYSAYDCSEIQVSTIR